MRKTLEQRDEEVRKASKIIGRKPTTIYMDDPEDESPYISAGRHMIIGDTTKFKPDKPTGITFPIPNGSPAERWPNKEYWEEEEERLRNARKLK